MIKFHITDKKCLLALSSLFVTMFIISGCRTVANEFVEANANVMSSLDADKIYNGITINNIPVSGLTKEEAVIKVSDEILAPIKNQKIIIKNGDNSWAFDLESLNYTFGTEKAVEEAYNIARTGSDEERYKEYQLLQSTPLDITLDVSYDDSTINTFLQKISRELYVKPLEPTMKRENGKITAFDGTNGVALDIIETKKLMMPFVNNNTGGETELALTDIPPKFSADDLRKTTDIIGTFSTSITGSASRDVNLTVASNYVNGTLLYPGDVFSTNKTIGETTYERGYRPAPVIVNGKLEQGMGGGVCQVSSTLYNAVLFAELDVVERRNHSLVVGYCPIGRDATLAGDYIDFKFKNSTNSPIYIENYIEGKRLVSSIYGVETRPSSRELKFESVYVSGTVIDVYKKVIVDGAVTDRIYVDRSTYRPSTGAASNQNADPVESIPDQTTDSGAEVNEVTDQSTSGPQSNEQSTVDATQTNPAEDTPEPVQTTPQVSETPTDAEAPGNEETPPQQYVPETSIQPEPESPSPEVETLQPELEAPPQYVPEPPAYQPQAETSPGLTRIESQADGGVSDESAASE